MYPYDPWHLTVIRTQGLLFIRPEKSWRPLVSVSVVEPHQTYDVVLGCDGQNPNLKMPWVLRDVDHHSRLDIKVWHKAHRKSRRKPRLVGSSYVSLGEILRRQERPGENVELRLTCPPPQKKSPTIGGRQQHSATLIVKLVAPFSASSSSSKSSVASSPTSKDENDSLSDSSSKSPSETLIAPTTLDSSEETWPEKASSDVGVGDNQIRRRKKRRIRGYNLDSDGDDYGSSSTESSRPPTPLDDYFPPLTGGNGTPSHAGDDRPSKRMAESVWNLFVPMLLPRHVADQNSVQQSLSWPETLVDLIAPYRELQEATLESDYDKILGRLLTEWYVVGASLLALAGIDAAVFGLAPGSILPVDSFAQHVVAFGAIAAGLGVAVVSWFLVVYSGANIAKFQRLTLDVYGSYFFFCLTCRIPTVCMFLSALSLMVFLLTVAWSATPGAVLVMSCVAGVLLTLQYLVFGAHRLLNFCWWCSKRCWRAVRRRRQGQVGETDAPPSRGSEVHAMRDSISMRMESTLVTEKIEHVEERVERCA